MLPAPTGEVLPASTGEKLPATTGEVLPAATGEVLPATTGEMLPATTGEVLPATTQNIRKFLCVSLSATANSSTDTRVPLFLSPNPIYLDSQAARES